MKILLTGCAGFIGSHCLIRMLAEGHHVVGIDNFSCRTDPRAQRSEFEQLLKSVESSSRFELIDHDLREPSCYERILAAGVAQFDAIIHLAACSPDEGHCSSGNTTICNNADIDEQVLMFSKQHVIPRIIYASSDCTYGKSTTSPFKEADPRQCPSTPFAQQKIQTERLGEALIANGYGLEHFIALRLFSVYGPRQPLDRMIPSIARSISEDRSVDVNGDGHSRQDYCYIDDVVSGILGALHYNNSDFEVINLGSGTSIELQEVIAQIEHTLGIQADITEYPGDSNQPRIAEACTRKAERLLGFQHRTSFEEGIYHFAEWFLQAQLQQTPTQQLK